MDLISTAARLIMIRTEAYLADMGRPESLNAYPALSTAAGRLSDDDLKEWAAVTEEKRSRKRADKAKERYLYAMDILGGESVLQTLMELCATEFFYPEFSAYLQANFGCGSCLHIASLIEGREGLSYEEIHDYASVARKLLPLDMRSEPLEYATVRADERLIGFLSGSDEAVSTLAGFITLYRSDDKTLHEPFANKKLMEQGASHFRSGGRMLCIAGEGGRRFIARHIARELGRDFIFLNIADLIRKAKEDDIAFVRDALIREAYYDRAGICLYGFDNRFITGGTSDMERGRRDMASLAGQLFEPVTDEGIPLMICTDELKMIPSRNVGDTLKCLSLPVSYSFDERKMLWQGLFDLHGLKLDAASFASRYRMNPSEASAAVEAYIEGRADNRDDEERFAKISIESIKNDSEVGRIVYADVRLDDVKLKDSVKRVLYDAVNAVLSGPMVLDEWGLRKSYPYGKGVSLLMAGPPGTGKTMSANAIAGELSLPLYQVNLSHTVDKYIGETEKNLEKAFSFAEKNNVILFFDEADALFGARSEVRDSRDRYANTEISYLLQRMEVYDGIVVMATNIKGNIDPAFMRRIRYVAHFENPDEEMRRAIWESCIKDSVPHEEIDIAYLASQFDKFTGSVIKTVFLNACVKAAGDKERLSMKHLVYAIKQETEKESAVGFTMDTIGKYAYLI